MQAVFRLKKPVVPYSAVLSTMFHDGNQVLCVEQSQLLLMRMPVLYARWIVIRMRACVQLWGSVD